MRSQTAHAFLALGITPPYIPVHKVVAPMSWLHMCLGLAHGAGHRDMQTVAHMTV